MKSPLLFAALALSLCLPAAPVGRAAEPEHKKKAEETELGNTMEKMNGAWRKLKKQAGDATNNAASLALVATMKACAEKALTLKPARAEDVPAAGRADFVADYQKDMKEFVSLVGELEKAFQAGDNAAAQALIQKMGAAQKEGHKEFKRPDL
ncbi:MAG: cytochrome b562 [bacterium]|nr:cytochrome b562 [bacterium]MDI1337990.1 cytochrome b562 [Lacunisphaera sp.]